MSYAPLKRRETAARPKAAKPVAARAKPTPAPVKPAIAETSETPEPTSDESAGNDALLIQRKCDTCNQEDEEQPGDPLAGAQPKLFIGSPDDPLEREADRVAEAVVSGLARPTVTADAQPAAQPPTTTTLRRTPAHSLPTEAPTDATPAEPALDDVTIDGDPETLRRACAACDAASDDDEIQRDALPGGAASGPLPTTLTSDLRAARSGGIPLPAGIRSSMEASFGADFSPVKIHTDAASHRLSRQLHARAFTLGPDIFFAAKQFRPTERAGQHLLAHELTHTLQQRHGLRILRRAPDEPMWSDAGAAAALLDAFLEDTITQQEFAERARQLSDPERERLADLIVQHWGHPKIEAAAAAIATTLGGYLGRLTSAIGAATKYGAATLATGVTTGVETLGAAASTGANVLAEQDHRNKIELAIETATAENDIKALQELVLDAHLATESLRLKMLRALLMDGAPREAVLPIWATFGSNLGDVLRDPEGQLLWSTCVDRGFIDRDDPIPGMSFDQVPVEATLPPTVPPLPRPVPKPPPPLPPPPPPPPSWTDHLSTNITAAGQSVLDSGRQVYDNMRGAASVEFKRAIDEKDDGAIRALADKYILATNEERQGMLEVLLSSEPTPGAGIMLLDGPLVEVVSDGNVLAIRKLWLSFGLERPEVLATDAGLALWDRSVERAQVDDLPFVETYRELFANDVYDEVLRALDYNEKLVKTELDRLGLTDTHAAQTNDQQAALAKLQAQAKVLAKILEEREALREQDVGFNERDGGLPQDFSGGYDVGEPVEDDGPPAPEPNPYDLPIAKFDPEHRPTITTTHGFDFQSWDALKAEDDKHVAKLREAGDRSPTLYALIKDAKDNRTALDDYAKLSSEAALARSRDALTKMYTAIRDARPQVKTRLTYDQFVPVHQRLFSGSPSLSQLDWKSKFFERLAKADLARRKSVDFWVTLGLDSLQAALFICAPIPVIGPYLMAAGFALSAARTTNSIFDYYAAKDARDTTASSSTEIVDDNTVSEKGWSAVINSGFTLADGVSFVRTLWARATAHGARTRALQAVRSANKPTDELLQNATPEAAEKRIGELLDEHDVPGTLKKAGGWFNVVTLLGPESRLGERFLRWRSELAAELKKKFNAIATGKDLLSSDFDVSTLGPDSYMRLLEVRRVVAKKFRVEPDELQEILAFSGFNDPRRSHMYDMVDAATVDPEQVARLAAFDQHVIQASRAATAAAHRIPFTPPRGGSLYPLTNVERDILGKKLDKLHVRFEAADDAAKPALAETITKLQMLLNAADNEAYIGLAVRKQVSRREGMKGVDDLAEATQRPNNTAENLSDASDQARKIEEIRFKFSGMVTLDKPFIKSLENALKLTERQLNAYEELIKEFPALAKQNLSRNVGAMIPTRAQLADLRALLKTGKVSYSTHTKMSTVFFGVRVLDHLIAGVIQKELLAGGSDFARFQWFVHTQLAYRQYVDPLLVQLTLFAAQQAVNELNRDVHDGSEPAPP